MIDDGLPRHGGGAIRVFVAAQPNGRIGREPPWIVISKREGGGTGGGGYGSKAADASFQQGSSVHIQKIYLQRKQALLFIAKTFGRMAPQRGEWHWQEII
jgi:hypothetical protein